jgi:hypothetical protein
VEHHGRDEKYWYGARIFNDPNIPEQGGVYVMGKPVKTDLKADQGKLEWSALPWDILPEIVTVCVYGNSKYAPDNWRHGSDPVRYWNAALRHLLAWKSGEKVDPESGQLHLAHAVVSLLYAMVLDK